TTSVSSRISLKRLLDLPDSPAGGPSSQTTPLQPRKTIAAIACSHLRTTSSASARSSGAGTLQLGQELVHIGGGQRVPFAHQPPVGRNEVGLGYAAHSI